MNILSIGNSFSQDAHRWLHQVADNLGADFHCVNLYIGGCSLQQHWDCYSREVAEHLLEENGEAVRLVSIQEALSLADWDVITLQQASHDSGLYDTYQPFLRNLSAAIKATCPRAKIYLQQTWAYASDSTHWAFPRYHNDQAEMYAALIAAYKQAADDIDAGIIPVGEVIQYMRQNASAFAAVPLTRDGFHLSLTYGRYAAALTWCGMLTDKDVRNCTFVPWDESGAADEALLAAVNQAVWQVLESKKMR
ncbi:MAG: DUF4886 domain-containing protein [Clostridia bacterium]|nr:DUF4886 domain-containing protein [Clostridia bacterium]